MKRRRAAAEKTPLKAGSKELKGLDNMFNSYRDAEEVIDRIGPEGVEKFCSDLGIDPTDRKVLLLAWKMGAKKMGFFTREEFKQGFTELGVATLAGLKKALPGLEVRLKDPQAFHEFYGFAFSFCLTDPGQKIIDVDTAAQMLQLAMPQGRFVKQFSEFLLSQTEYKKVNRDQWNNFLRFSREVRTDLSNSGDNPAWPLLLDNFVDWYQQHHHRKH